MKLLALIFGRNVYKLFSIGIAFILKSKGLKIGKNFYIEGVPYLKIRGQANNITIGDNVKIFGSIDLRNRENGQIIIGNNVEIDNDCRFVAANNAVLEIKEHCYIGPYNIFNAGEDIRIASYTISGSFVHIQSSNHGLRRSEKIWLQKHTYGKVIIEEDVWLGANSTLLQGIRVGQGAVIAAKAVVTNDVSEYKIVAGVPARVVGERE